MFRILITLFLAFGLNACQTLPSNNRHTLADQYRLAVEDASVATADEISNSLIPIIPENPNLVWRDSSKTKLKVVTWKSVSSYQKYLLPATKTPSSEANVIWVTSAPQVQDFCRNYMQQNPNASAEELNLRLKQYLGLNHNWEYDRFIELWVDAADLFRPCVDPEINDRSCNLAFGDDRTVEEVMVSGITDYKRFYQNLYFNDFRYRQTNSPTPAVPWTGLGYTYDWGNSTTPVGASEFIITPGAPYEIVSSTATMEYCQTPSP